MAMGTIQTIHMHITTRLVCKQGSTYSTARMFDMYSSHSTRWYSVFVSSVSENSLIFKVDDDFFISTFNTQAEGLF